MVAQMKEANVANIFENEKRVFWNGICDYAIVTVFCLTRTHRDAAAEWQRALAQWGELNPQKYFNTPQLRKFQRKKQKVKGENVIEMKFYIQFYLWNFILFWKITLKVINNLTSDWGCRADNVRVNF